MSIAWPSGLTNPRGNSGPVGAVTAANEILCNSEPELHAHVPRYATEPSDLRRLPAWFYDWDAASRYNADTHAELRNALRITLLGDAEP